MAKLSISARRQRQFKVTTTDSAHASFPVAVNLLNRESTTIEPDRAWVVDMTDIAIAEGWLYLAVNIDLFSPRVVGWSMAEHMRTELVSTALEAALGHRISASAELVFHSDRGSSYASNDYQATLELSDITCSTRRRANCWDIPVAESFFGTLETELIHPTIFTTKAKAKTVIAE